jgi:hypothetical protein
LDASFKEIIWRQFGAAIDMLENALTACQHELWNTPSQFWYNGYHTLFYLDYYLSDDPDNFLPPAPFTLSEFDPGGLMPDRVYSKAELLDYLQFCRRKFHAVIAGLTAETAAKRFINKQRNYSVTEMLLYNMRHVQHHTAQLNLLLRQNKTEPPRWVSATKLNL